MSTQFNLADIQHFLDNDQETKDFFLRKTASDYDSFVRVLKLDLLRIIKDMQHDRHLYQDNTFGEDALSSVIIKCLRCLNYDAEHDTQHGGHCDILVKHSQQGFEWIGEAKLWKGQSYVTSGLEQLLDRYATGTSGESSGGLIVYVKQPNALDKLKKWHQELSSHASTVSIDALPERVRDMHFDSVQTATASGLAYDLTSFFVVLNHATSTEPEYDADGQQIAA
ncbi:hypothetical protein [Vibrio sp. MMH1-50]|uniref:hypothetical protein n=1 Tax=Vibrio sp. MMH1-50 TaxID=2917764 RepID=UPI001EF236AE|nr:hypothetical protein [Vibrio sp. MMH1-50]MCG7515273.1 hypothetical protein [Vibrio sp. MMH1-50]